MFRAPNVSIEKNEKNQINLRERRHSRSLRGDMHEALQSRANSVKRAIYNVVEHSEPGRPKRYQRRLSVSPFEALKITTSNSGNSSPCTSPQISNIPPINIISPTMETARFTCISPLPDNRRESMEEYFLNAVNLPVPRQFADSRRSSGAVPPEIIHEDDESFYNPSTSSLPLSLCHQPQIATNALTTNKTRNNQITTEMTIEKNFLRVPIITDNDITNLDDLRPIEVQERNYYMTCQLNHDLKSPVEKSFLNIVDKDSISGIQKESVQKENMTEDGVLITCHSNVYTSDNLTIIDMDEQTVYN